MGSNDVPPAHVPAHVVPTSILFLQAGGALWTACYVLYARESFRSQSYGMPLFALALNFAWEVVYGAFVAEAAVEQAAFLLWLAVDCVMIYGTVKYARHEWAHSPAVARHIGSIFAVMVAAALLGHGAFAKWWIDNDVGKREGKIYGGVVGPDTSELGFWSACVCQLYLSAASLCQLVVRQHSGGVSWNIWATRTLGSVVGFYLVYGWQWYYWPEAHPYFLSPFGAFMWVTALLCDCAYPYVLWQVRRKETVLPDGRKVAGVGGRSSMVDGKKLS